MAFWKKILKSQEEAKAASQDPAVPSRGAAKAKKSEEAGETGRVSHALHAGDTPAFPMMTEKASMLQARGQYMFRVPMKVSKPEVKRAISRRYGVTVTSVRVAVMPGKERRRGRITGWKPGFKRAIVTIGKGETIDMQ